MIETTMSEAATTNSSDNSSTSPQGNSATADALYGNQQQANAEQTQQVAEPTKAAEAQGNQPDAPTDGKQDEKPADAKPQGAPEKYEFKQPDGAGFDPEVITAFSEVARELNLSQEAAQKVLDRMTPKMMERQAAQVEAIRSEWAETSRMDKEIGGERLADNLSVAKKALDAFGTAELRTLLNESGLGNHPEVIRFMFRAGRAISEDRYVGQSNSTPARRSVNDFNSAAAALYSNQS